MRPTMALCHVILYHRFWFFFRWEHRQEHIYIQQRTLGAIDNLHEWSPRGPQLRLKSFKQKLIRLVLSLINCFRRRSQLFIVNTYDPFDLQIFATQPLRSFKLIWLKNFVGFGKFIMLQICKVRANVLGWFTRGYSRWFQRLKINSVNL